MRAGSRFVATLLAALAWIFAALSMAPQPPMAQQAVVPVVLDVAASAAASAVE